jgi:hypothetical protein
MDGIVTFNAAARKASVVFAATLIPSLCAWSPAFAQQPTNWMRERVQLRVLEQNLKATAQAARVSGERRQAIVNAIARPKIVGGVDATPTDNPFQVALLTKSIANNQDAQYCGGSLVASNFVVTAAHCSDFVTASNVQVLTGTQDLDGTGDRRDVVSITIHAAWNPSTMDSDVAVWELSTDATGIVLATLATEDGAVDDPLLATGWGATEAGPPPIHLRAVSVPLVSEANCNDANSYNGDVTATMLCAGLDAGGKDTCQGDSGGPLTRGPGNTVLTGITSWGIGCADANFFGVYTRVSNPAIRDFVEQVVAGGTGPGPIPTPSASGCSLCYTCGGNWPTFAGQIGQDTASGPAGLNAPAIERGSACREPLAPSSDTAPFLCCGQ